MSKDDTTKQLPTEDRLESLIALVQRAVSDLGRVMADLSDVKTRVQSLETKFEKSAFDTKPLWERALAEIVEVRNQITESNKETRASLKEMDRKLNRIQAEFSTAIMRQDELEDRLDRIDSKAS